MRVTVGTLTRACMGEGPRVSSAPRPESGPRRGPRAWSLTAGAQGSRAEERAAGTLGTVSVVWEAGCLRTSCGGPSGTQRAPGRAGCGGSRGEASVGPVCGPSGSPVQGRELGQGTTPYETAHGGAS